MSGVLPLNSHSPEAQSSFSWQRSPSFCLQPDRETRLATPLQRRAESTKLDHSADLLVDADA